MTWPTSKLDMINECLSLTGNDTCNVAEDGSDEWKCASAGYEFGLEALADNHNWNFATIVGTLAPTPTPPTDEYFTHAYNKPSDLIHLIWVRLDGLPVFWQILNNQIVLNAFGTLPGQIPPSSSTPGVVTAKWVSSNNFTAQETRPFATALKAFVMMGIYRGLHEDLAEARAMQENGVLLVRQAKTRADQEQPKRAFFNSRLYASRRMRRPWPRVPAGWGGTGSPG